MQKIEINGDLDKYWVISLLAEGMDTYQILMNYPITEEIIAECGDLLDKQVLLLGFTFTEKFIRNSLQNNFFGINDIQNLNMSTYAGLSNQFIEEYHDYLNWNRLIVYLSIQDGAFSDYISIIEKKNLWKLISANDLPIDFIRQYKDKLDWSLLSIAKCFTNEEKIEFSDFIIETKQELIEEDSSTEFNLLTDYSVDEISNIIDKYLSDKYQDFYSEIN